MDFLFSFRHFRSNDDFADVDFFLWKIFACATKLARYAIQAFQGTHRIIVHNLRAAGHFFIIFSKGMDKQH